MAAAQSPEDLTSKLNPCLGMLRCWAMCLVLGTLHIHSRTLAAAGCPFEPYAAQGSVSYFPLLELRTCAKALERIAGLLEDADGSVTLSERGDVSAVARHPSFRLFAAMNPATDAGRLHCQKCACRCSMVPCPSTVL